MEPGRPARTPPAAQVVGRACKQNYKSNTLKKKKASLLDSPLASRREPSEPPPWVGRAAGLARGRRGGGGTGCGGCALGPLPRGRRGARPGCDAGPRCPWRPADLRAEPGGLEPPTGAGRRDGSDQGSGEPGPAGSGEVTGSDLGLRWGGGEPDAARLRGGRNQWRHLDLASCWESSVLVFPACGLGVGLKLAGVAHVMAGPPNLHPSGGRSVAALAPPLPVAWPGDPAARVGALPGPPGIGGPWWPLSPCHCPQASREGTQGE